MSLYLTNPLCSCFIHLTNSFQPYGVNIILARVCLARPCGAKMHNFLLEIALGAPRSHFFKIFTNIFEAKKNILRWIFEFFFTIFRYFSTFFEKISRFSRNFENFREKKFFEKKKKIFEIFGPESGFWCGFFWKIILEISPLAWWWQSKNFVFFLFADTGCPTFGTNWCFAKRLRAYWGLRSGQIETADNLQIAESTCLSTWVCCARTYGAEQNSRHSQDWKIVGSWWHLAHLHRQRWANDSRCSRWNAPASLAHRIWLSPSVGDQSSGRQRELQLDGCGSWVAFLLGVLLGF